MVQALIKFRMSDGTDKYVNKNFNNKSHLDAYIKKVCRESGCFLDEVWDKTHTLSEEGTQEFLTNKNK